MDADPATEELRAELSRALAEGRISPAEVAGVAQRELDDAFGVATRLLVAGEPQAALDVVGLLAILDFRQARFLTLGGSCLTALGQWEAAGEIFAMALSLDPSDRRAQLCLGEVLVRLGAVAEGLELLEQGLGGEGGSVDDLLPRARKLVEIVRTEEGI